MIQNNIFESLFVKKKTPSILCKNFSSDSLNFVHILPMTVSEKVEEFDFSISNNVAGVKISNTMDIMEIISYYRSDTFTLINLELPANSYRIACTKNQNFEEGENCAPTILVEQSLASDVNLFGSDMILFGSDMKLFGSGF